MLNLRLSPRAEELRRDFDSWLLSNSPPKLPKAHSLKDFVEISSTWQSKLAEGRWIGVHWPEEYGGRNLGFVEEAMLQEALAASGSPQLVNLFGLTMVGPVLIKHGTQEQKQRYLKKILSAEEIWCQGFSEPGAGSDLASLKTRAEKIEAEKKSQKESQWRINGQKVWTSFAQYAKWCFLLVRTGVKDSKHKGLSYLLVPMSAPGITVRSLTQITGEQEFNEVFYEDVCTDANNIVGKEGQGWEIAISTLMYERAILTFARHLQSEQLLQRVGAALSTRAELDIGLRTEFGRHIARSSAVRALALSHLVAYDNGQTPGPEGSLDKLGWSEAFQALAKFAFQINPNNTDFQHQYLYSRGRTIAAGTSEIQRNIIAERILSLPR